MSIKHLLVFFIAFISLNSCSQNSRRFTINAEISGMPEQTVMLQELSSGVSIKIIDSVHAPATGQFQLSGIAPEPGLYRLQFTSGNYILLSIDKGYITITGDWKKIHQYKVEGSDPSRQLQIFMDSLRNFVSDLNQLGIVIDTMTKRGNDSVKMIAEKQQQDISVKFTQFIEHYADTTTYLPNSIFAATLLNPVTEISYLETLSQHLLHRFPNAKMSKEFGTYCMNTTTKLAKTTAKTTTMEAGMRAPDIHLPDKDGKIVTLSDLHGKYVLVNFWATWEKTSVQNIAYINTTYEKYKQNNFVVFNISLDNKKEDWENGMKANHMHFTDLSDGKGLHSEAATAYNIQRLPANFLVDTSGKIMAKNLLGDALGEILSRVYKDK